MNSLYYLCNFFFENKVYFKICSPYSGKEPACQRGEVRDASVIPRRQEDRQMNQPPSLRLK